MKFYYPKDKNGNRIGFKTPESQVYDTNGRSLTDKLTELNSNMAGLTNHPNVKANASTYGHVKLSDTYNSSVSGGNAAGGLGASQNALFNAYNVLSNGLTKKPNLNGNANFNYLCIDTNLPNLDFISENKLVGSINGNSTGINITGQNGLEATIQGISVIDLKSSINTLINNLTNTCLLSEVEATINTTFTLNKSIYTFNKIYFIIGANGGIRTNCCIYPVKFLQDISNKQIVISVDEISEGYSSFIQFSINEISIYVNAIGFQGWENPPTISVYGSY